MRPGDVPHPDMNRTIRATPQGAADLPYDVHIRERSLAAAMLQTLKAWGCGHVFLVPGAQIDGFAKHLSEEDVPRPIVAGHELAAGFMADGYSRASGRPGVAMAIGGPGAANLVGAAAAAKADASPVLFVTGNIPASGQGSGDFQDAWPGGSNDAGVFRAAIGESLVVDAAEVMHECLHRARQLMAQGHSVHIMVPLDVQNACVAAAEADENEDKADPEVADRVVLPEWLVKGRPVLVICGQAIDHIDTQGLDVWSGRWAIPVITDAAARGILPETSPHALGHVGFMPHPRALAALAGAPGLAADRVIAVGPCAGVLSQCEPSVPRYEIDPDVFNRLLRTDFAVVDRDVASHRAAWLNRLRQIDRKPPQTIGADSQIPLAGLVDYLAASLPTDTIYCIDSGQIRRVAISRLRSPAQRTILSAEKLAPMGWGICAAIGAKLARPERPVAALVGDGSMRMHGVELATAARYGLSIVFVLCDNQAYGSMLSRPENQRTLAELPPVDWCGFAAALGVASCRLHSVAELPSILAAFRTSGAPLLITVSVPLVDADAYREPSGIHWLSRSDE